MAYKGFANAKGHERVEQTAHGLQIYPAEQGDDAGQPRLVPAWASFTLVRPTKPAEAIQ